MASSSRFTLGGVTINYCKFYQMLEVINERDGMEGGCRSFLPKSSTWLKLIGRRMELENPFASVLDSATSGMNALRAEWQVVSNGIRFSGVSKRIVIFE